MQRAWGHGIFDAKKGEVSAACWSELEGEKGATQRSEGFQEQENKTHTPSLLWELNELRYLMYLNCLEHKKLIVIMREMFNNLQTVVGSPYFWHTAKFRQQVFLLKESQETVSITCPVSLAPKPRGSLIPCLFSPLTFNPSPSLIALPPTSSTLLLAHFHNCHTSVHRSLGESSLRNCLR